MVLLALFLYALNYFQTTDSANFDRDTLLYANLTTLIAHTHKKKKDLSPVDSNEDTVDNKNISTSEILEAYDLEGDDDTMNLLQEVDGRLDVGEAVQPKKASNSKSTCCCCCSLEPIKQVRTRLPSESDWLFYEYSWRVHNQYHLWNCCSSSM